jgi:hypothetical protein
LTSWRPATKEEVQALFAQGLETLSPWHRRQFERIRTPLTPIDVDDHPGASVYAVAAINGLLVYWSDVEEGWEAEQPTSAGSIPARGRNQFELSHIAHRLFGDPTE